MAKKDIDQVRAEPPTEDRAPERPGGKAGKTQGQRLDRGDPYPTLPRRSLVRDRLPGEAP